jgi:hypothetical protein
LVFRTGSGSTASHFGARVQQAAGGRLTTDSGAAREFRLRLWAEHLGCTEDDLRHADPVAILDGRWVEAAHAQQRIVTRRSGPLTAALYPNPRGHIMADFGPGEVESALLDR